MRDKKKNGNKLSREKKKKGIRSVNKNVKEKDEEEKNNSLRIEMNFFLSKV
jgi:hypothetical protein